MEDTTKIDEIVEHLNEIIPGLDLVLTVKGDELKGWTRDTEEGGTRKFYLSRSDCARLAEIFTTLSTELR